MRTFADQLSPVIRGFLEMAPVDWDDYFNGLDDRQRQQVTEELSAHAQAFARGARYFLSREVGQSHGQAVRDQNRTAKTVRKALGYTYPTLDYTF